MQGVLGVIFQNESYEPKIDFTVPETNSHVLKKGKTYSYTNMASQIVCIANLKKSANLM